MSALISRTDDIICMLDVNMMVEKLRAMLKFFETDRQTHRLFQKGQIRYQESILRHFRAKFFFFYSKIPRNGQTKLKMPTSALLNIGIKIC